MNEATISRQIVEFLSKQPDCSALRSKLLKKISGVYSGNTIKDTYEAINLLKEAGCLTFHRDDKNQICFRLEDPAFELFKKAKEFSAGPE